MFIKHGNVRPSPTFLNSLRRCNCEICGRGSAYRAYRALGDKAGHGLAPGAEDNTAANRPLAHTARRERLERTDRNADWGCARAGEPARSVRD